MVQFSVEQMHRAKKIIARYPEGRQKSALIPLLHLAQESFEGWLSVEVMDYIAELLDITPVEVYEVASFYTMFNLKPTGKYVFEVCQTGPCMINGCEDIITYVQKKLNIKIGETTADGLFTLKVVECLGACGYAPMMQLGKNYKEFLTFEKIDKIIDECIRHNADSIALEEIAS